MDGEAVNVLGWYGKNNVGDEAYKLAFPILFPNTPFNFSTVSPAIPRNLVIGGGDTVTSEKLLSLTKARGRRNILSVTISKPHTASEFAGVDSIHVRDRASLELLNKIGVDAELCPDFAFALTPNTVNGDEYVRKLFHAETADLYKKRIAVVLNSHLLHSQSTYQHVTFQKLVFDIAQLSDWTDASLIFIPFETKSPWDDRVPAGMVQAQCKWHKKNVVIYDRLPPQMVLDVISSCDAVLSMRLHSSIFASVCGVPFVDITHNHKNPAFLESIGKSDWGIPFMSFDEMKCKKMVDRCLIDDGMRSDICQIALQQKKSLLRVAQNVRLV